MSPLTNSDHHRLRHSTHMSTHEHSAQHSAHRELKRAASATTASESESRCWTWYLTRTPRQGGQG